MLKNKWKIYFENKANFNHFDWNIVEINLSNNVSTNKIKTETPNISSFSKLERQSQKKTIKMMLSISMNNYLSENHWKASKKLFSFVGVVWRRNTIIISLILQQRKNWSLCWLLCIWNNKRKRTWLCGLFHSDNGYWENMWHNNENFWCCTWK